MLRLSIIVFIALLLWLAPIEGARTYIVDDDGFANHRTIGEAVAAASSGDTIYIKPGTYSEEVLLNKTLTLMPLTGETGPIVLKGDGKKTGITIVADGCSIEGLTLDNFAGPGIRVQSSGNTLKNNRFEKDNPAVLVISSSENTISKNIMKDCEGGVALWADALNNTVSENEIDGGSVSIVLRDVGKNTVSGNRASQASISIWVMNSSQAEVTGNDVESKSLGIWIFNSTHSRLIDNSVADGERGIHLINSSSTNINNNMVKDVKYGFIIENSHRNSITNCTIENTTNALGLSESSGNAIAGNSILNTGDTGVELAYSDGNSLTDNRFQKSERGIIIAESKENVLEANSLDETKWGLYVEGSTREGFNNAISESNTVNGKPIAYFYGQSGKAVKGRDLAHLTLAYCNGFDVDGNTISNDALFLFNSDNNKISENNISGCYGMRILDSSANNITRNTMDENRFSGLFLVNSNSNTIDSNSASKNNQNGISFISCSENVLRDNTVDHNYEAGIWLNLSNDNQIFQNNISNNPLGLQVLYSSGNRIYRNNFIGNKEPAEDREGNNIWDMGNVTGGNYWSGHTAKGNPSSNWPMIIKGTTVRDEFPFQDASGWLLSKPDGISG